MEAGFTDGLLASLFFLVRVAPAEERVFPFSMVPTAPSGPAEVARFGRPLVSTGFEESPDFAGTRDCLGR